MRTSVPMIPSAPLDTFRAMQERDEEIVRWAAQAAQALVATAAREGAELDYTRESVARLEDLLRGPLADRRPWRRGRPARKYAALAMLCGAYVGEVLVRELGGRWAFSEQAGQGGIHFGGESWAFPVHKAEKRFANGAEDDLASFTDFAAMVAKGEIA